MANDPLFPSAATYHSLMPMVRHARVALGRKVYMIGLVVTFLFDKELALSAEQYAPFIHPGGVLADNLSTSEVHSQGTQSSVMKLSGRKMPSMYGVKTVHNYT